jgi:signal transduction histidine kinase
MLQPRPVLLLIVLLLMGWDSYSQSLPVTDVAKGREATRFQYNYGVASFERDLPVDSIPYISFKTVQPQGYPVTRQNFVGRQFIFSFPLFNSSSTPDTVLFMPGLFQNVGIFLYDSAAKRLIPVTDKISHVTPYTLETLYFSRLIIPAGEHRTLYITSKFRHFNWDYWDPRLYRNNTLDDKLLVYQFPSEIRSNVIAAVMLGIFLAILGYTMILYFQYRQREYLWYLAYVTAMTLYFTFMALGNLAYSISYHQFDMLLPALLQIGAHLIYFFFAKRILNLPQNTPSFNRQINVVIGILAAYLVFHCFISWDDDLYALNAFLFFCIRIFLSLFSIYGVIVLYRSKIPLSGYIATGVSCVIVFGLISMFITSGVSETDTFVDLIGGSMTFFRIGVVIELFLFLVAITEKSKAEIINKVRTIELLQLENKRKELEKSMIALETQTAERRRISAEMHDDIGSGLTTIQFLSNSLPHDQATRQEQTIQKITHTSQQLMEKMNEIVWSLNQEFDTLPDTIAYIRNTVSELLENAGIGYEFSTPDNIPDIKLGGTIRRNLYLVVKEATHNIIKHAAASKVVYTIRVDDELLINIHDNGKGPGANSSGFGNGLKNMNRRMTDSGGDFTMRAENGTSLTLTMPL